jgi:hypothetical protein
MLHFFQPVKADNESAAAAAAAGQTSQSYDDVTSCEEITEEEAYPKQKWPEPGQQRRRRTGWPASSAAAAEQTEPEKAPGSVAQDQPWKQEVDWRSLRQEGWNQGGLQARMRRQLARAQQLLIKQTKEAWGLPPDPGSLQDQVREQMKRTPVSPEVLANAVLIQNQVLNQVRLEKAMFVAQGIGLAASSLNQPAEAQNLVGVTSKFGRPKAPPPPLFENQPPPPPPPPPPPVSDFAVPPPHVSDFHAVPPPPDFAVSAAQALHTAVPPPPPPTQADFAVSAAHQPLAAAATPPAMTATVKELTPQLVQGQAVSFYTQALPKQTSAASSSSSTSGLQTWLSPPPNPASPPKPNPNKIKKEIVEVNVDQA